MKWKTAELSVIYSYIYYAVNVESMYSFARWKIVDVLNGYSLKGEKEILQQILKDRCKGKISIFLSGRCEHISQGLKIKVYP